LLHWGDCRESNPGFAMAGKSRKGKTADFPEQGKYSPLADEAGGVDSDPDEPQRIVKLESMVATLATQMQASQALLRQILEGAGSVPSGRAAPVVNNPPPLFNMWVEQSDPEDDALETVMVTPPRAEKRNLALDNRPSLPKEVVEGLAAYGLDDDVSQRLTRSFRNSLGTTLLSWEAVYATGVIPRTAFGWRRHLPERGPLAVLVPWWLAHHGEGLDGRRAQNMMPVLVEKLPTADVLNKSQRVPGAWCTSLESFLRVFMETLAQVGPGNRGTPAAPQLSDWHTEETLVGLAIVGMGYHPKLQHALQLGERPRTLMELLELGTQILRTDEESIILDASRKMHRLHLRHMGKRELLELRGAFAEVAAVLGGSHSEESLRQSFIGACLRDPRSSEALHRFFQSPEALKARTWDQVWSALYTLVLQSRTTRTLGEDSADPPIPLNHLKVEDDGDVDFEDSEEEADVYLNHLTTSSRERLERTRERRDALREELRDACYQCTEKGHHTKDCPHQETVTLPSGRARALIGFARAHLRREGLRHASGGGYRPLP
jgi:hypothetical protein